MATASDGWRRSPPRDVRVGAAQARACPVRPVRVRVRALRLRCRHATQGDDTVTRALLTALARVYERKGCRKVTVEFALRVSSGGRRVLASTAPTQKKKTQPAVARPPGNRPNAHTNSMSDRFGL